LLLLPPRQQRQMPGQMQGQMQGQRGVRRRRWRERDWVAIGSCRASSVGSRLPPRGGGGLAPEPERLNPLSHQAPLLLLPRGRARVQGGERRRERLRQRCGGRRSGGRLERRRGEILGSPTLAPFLPAPALVPASRWGQRQRQRQRQRVRDAGAPRRRRQEAKGRALPRKRRRPPSYCCSYCCCCCCCCCCCPGPGPGPEHGGILAAKAQCPAMLVELELLLLQGQRQGQRQGQGQGQRKRQGQRQEQRQEPSRPPQHLKGAQRSSRPLPSLPPPPPST